MSVASSECPLSGCDYVGHPSSVEAHISGSKDEIHRGKVGNHFQIGPEDASEGPELDDEDLAVLEADSLSEPERDENGEIVDPGRAMLIGTLALAVVVLLLAASSSSSSTGQPDSSEDDQDDLEDLGGLA